MTCPQAKSDEPYDDYYSKSSIIKIHPPKSYRGIIKFLLDGQPFNLSYHSNPEKHFDVLMKEYTSMNFVDVTEKVTKEIYVELVEA